MFRFETTYLNAIDNGQFGPNLVKTMKERHGTQCAGFLIHMLGDEDFHPMSLFSNFRLTTLVRGASFCHDSRLVMDDGFLTTLKRRCFWELNRTQMLRLKYEICSLFPDDFEFLHRWEANYEEATA